jgi:hypothetical protein
MLRGRRGTWSSRYSSSFPSRNEVYAAVDSEREYQEYVVEPSLAGQDQGLTEHTIGDELVLMKVYLDKAMSAAASRPTKETALDFVRKIVGVGVRCMENHGAPPRMVPREVNAQSTASSIRADSRWPDQER